MWKTIVLCALLFGAGAAGLAAGTRWIDPAALPTAAAIGLCLIGLVLILAAPSGGEPHVSSSLPEVPRPEAGAHAQPALQAVDVEVAAPTAVVSGAAGKESLPSC